MTPRFFLAQSLDCGSEVILPEALTHHVRVLRLNVGASLTLFNGNGGEYSARLCALGKRTAYVQIQDFSPREVELPFQLILAQAVAGGDKMDWLIEKAVELGVFAIQPLHTVRCVVRLDGERARRRLAHWQALARAACEQCGRNRVPDIYPLRSLDEWLAQPSQTQGILLSPTGEAVFSLVVKGMGQQAMTLLVGPEGGLSDEEETRAQLRGFIPAQLGQRILRCETAGLVAIAAAATIWGDF